MGRTDRGAGWILLPLLIQQGLTPLGHYRLGASPVLGRAVSRCSAFEAPLGCISPVRLSRSNVRLPSSSINLIIARVTIRPMHRPFRRADAVTQTITIWISMVAAATVRCNSAIRGRKACRFCQLFFMLCCNAHKNILIAITYYSWLLLNVHIPCDNAKKRQLTCQTVSRAWTNHLFSFPTERSSQNCWRTAHGEQSGPMSVPPAFGRLSSRHVQLPVFGETVPTRGLCNRRSGPGTDMSSGSMIGDWPRHGLGSRGRRLDCRTGARRYRAPRAGSLNIDAFGLAAGPPADCRWLGNAGLSPCRRDRSRFARTHSIRALGEAPMSWADVIAIPRLVNPILQNCAKAEDGLMRASPGGLNTTRRRLCASCHRGCSESQ